MITSIEQNIKCQRKLYQTIMSFGFSLNTDNRYNFLLRQGVFLGIFNWIMSCLIGAAYVLWKENITTNSERLEIIQYMMASLQYTAILIVLVKKKKRVTSNYNIIQSSFIQWSIKRGMDPNKTYRKYVQIVKRISIPAIFLIMFTFLGPLLAAVNDFGNIPLDDYSHFPLFWPRFLDANNFIIYGCIYLLQLISAVFSMILSGVYDFGFILIIFELNNQIEQLLYGINEAFVYRKENQFQNRMIDCIRQHQLVIKYVDDFKSYFKWIVLIEIIVTQTKFVLTIYSFLKVDSSFGYKGKMLGIVMINVIIFSFHCHLGEVLLSMHRRLAETIYEMSWYDMPNKNKQLIIIMLQRTQKDLTLNSAIFSSEIVSRPLMSKLIKNTYTILNVLLKT